MDEVIIINPNGIGGLDLGTERDAGNAVRILTGNQSLKFWQDMKKTAEIAIEQIKFNKKIKIYKGN